MLIAFSGPSGIGKGFIKDRLLRNHSTFTEIPWLTTRALRPDESMNGNRISVSNHEFDTLVQTGECVLVQGLYGNRYGVERSRLVPQPAKRLTEIHPKNVPAALAIAPDIILIGLVTSDYNLLRERMMNRSDKSSSIGVRLDAARAEVDLIRSQARSYSLVAEVSREIDAAEQVLNYIHNLLTREGEPHA